MTVAAAEARRGHAAMLLFAALIAGSFSLGKQAAPHIDPAALSAARFALATALMAGVTAALGRSARRAHFRAPWRFLLLGGLLSVYFVLMFVALRIADPVSTGAVFTLIPAMSAAFGWIFMRQRTAPRAALALAVGAAGAASVIFRGDPARIAAFEIGRGEAIFFVGCVAHALYAPLVPRLNRGEPVTSFTLGVLIAAAVLLAVWGAPAIAATDWAALPAVVWIAIGYLAAATTALTFFLLQYAAMRLPAGKVMAYGYLTPAFIVLYEGLAGRGWPPAPVWAGVAVTGAALAVLALEAPVGRTERAPT
jgi:drug/metabolite transporter (DMT)-like permease